ncbi:MAG: hypothetical protein M0R38_06910 [Bacteroidia bacterium]|nr:hypothetical protein [Bacteroidia bacterium]
MRKIILTALVLGVTMPTISAQEELSFKNKKGQEVLPQQSDWAFGIAANPFLNYAGNLLNGTNGNTSPVFVNANGPSILNGNFSLNNIAFMGKYMKSSNTAYRVRFAGNLYNQTVSGFVAKDVLINNVLLPEFVEDKHNIRMSNVLLGAGIEKRKGSKRLQGIYGAELFIGYVSRQDRFTYGNEMTTDFTAPASTNFASNVFVQGGRYYRTTYTNMGNTFLVGARGYVGAEYFITPKISLGGELGYSAAVARRGKSYSSHETFDFDNLTAEKVEFKNNNWNPSSFGLGLDNFNGGINLYFYF